MKKIIFIITFLFTSYLASQAIQVVEVEPSKQPEYVKVRIVLPKKAEVIKNPVWMQVRVRGFSLGTVSPLPRRNEIASSSQVQSLHVVVDDMPYFTFDGLSLDPLVEQGDYDEEFYKIKLPFYLSPGVHTLRVFPCRSFGEALNKSKNFDMCYFYINEKKGDVSFLRKPFLTYNEPTGMIKAKKTTPILLDFYVHNCDLSKNGYKVELTIDNNWKEELIKETPYYIYGLDKGQHRIRLRLLDKNGIYVKSPFNDIVRTIKIL